MIAGRILICYFIYINLQKKAKFSKGKQKTRDKADKGVEKEIGSDEECEGRDKGSGGEEDDTQIGGDNKEKEEKGSNSEDESGMWTFENCGINISHNHVTIS